MIEMQRIKFNKTIFLEKMKTRMFLLLSMLTFAALAFLLTMILSSTMNDMSSNPFKLNSKSDLIFLVSWIIAGCLPFIVLVRFRIKDKTVWKGQQLFEVFSILSFVLFVGSLIPLLNYTNEISAESVQKTISDTYVYCILFGVLLFAGFVGTLVVTRRTLEKSNWWAFLVAIPYIFQSWKVQESYSELKRFQDMATFDYVKVAEMIKLMKGDLFLINDLWFETFAMILVIFICLIGVVAGGIIWKKTERWRQS